MSKLKELQRSHKTIISNISHLKTKLYPDNYHQVRYLFRGNGSDLHEDLAEEAHDLVARLLHSAVQLEAQHKRKIDAIEELLGEQI
jgi:predicted metalloendopeptidase